MKAETRGTDEGMNWVRPGTPIAVRVTPRPLETTMTARSLRLTMASAGLMALTTVAMGTPATADDSPIAPRTDQTTHLAVATANLNAPLKNDKSAAIRKVRRSGAKVIGWQEAQGMDLVQGSKHWTGVRIRSFDPITWDTRYFTRVGKLKKVADFTPAGVDCGQHPRPQEALGVVLKSERTHEKVAVINTHMVPGAFSKQPSHKACWFAQTKLLIKLAKRFRDVDATVIVGDFNRGKMRGWTIGRYDNHVAAGHPTHGKAYLDRIFTKGNDSWLGTKRITLGRASDHAALKGRLTF